MKNSKSNVEERQQNIVKLVRRSGEVNSYDIANEFGISIMTVRRDLQELEHKHLLKRTHGGAESLDYVKGTKSLSIFLALAESKLPLYYSPVSDTVTEKHARIPYLVVGIALIAVSIIAFISVLPVL
jgi:DNA-binding Lrp family transcriptional regulator